MTPDFFSSIVVIGSQEAKSRGFGTGFLVCHDGQATYIVTCAHVIAAVGGETQIKVAGLPATIVAIGQDGFPDLAVLRVEGLTEKPCFRLQRTGQTGDTFLSMGFQSFAPDYLLRPLHSALGGQIGLVTTNQDSTVRAWDFELPPKI